MKVLNQEVLRVILLDTRFRQISTVEVTKESISDSGSASRNLSTLLSDNRFVPLFSSIIYRQLLVILSRR
jgi:hypothetical protein